MNSGSWWWTGRPGVLWFMGSQRVGHNWVTDLIWSDATGLPGSQLADGGLWGFKASITVSVNSCKESPLISLSLFLSLYIYLSLSLFYWFFFSEEPWKQRLPLTGLMGQTALPTAACCRAGKLDSPRVAAVRVSCQCSGYGLPRISVRSPQLRHWAVVLCRCLCQDLLMVAGEETTETLRPQWLSTQYSSTPGLSASPVGSWLRREKGLKLWSREGL